MDPAIVDGANAYAAEQACLRRKMGDRFRKLWTGDEEVLALLYDDAPETEKTTVAPVTVPYIYSHADSEDECGGVVGLDDSDKE